MDLLKANKPTVLGLVVVKFSVSKVQRVKLKVWRRAGHLYAVSNKNKVKIWMLWNRDLLLVKPLWQCEQAIVVQRTINQTRKTWYIAKVYASNLEKEMRTLWEESAVCIRNNPGSWIVGGDFNCSKFQNEKMGGNFIPTSKLIPFNKMFETSGLSNLKIIGAKWTWTNSQTSNLIACKVYRIIVNDDWYNLFPNSSTLADRLILSDHFPNMVTMGKDATFKFSSFKHFNSWWSREGYLEALAKGWSLPTSRCPIFRLAKKLKAAKNELIVRAKNERLLNPSR